MQVLDVLERLVADWYRENGDKKAKAPGHGVFQPGTPLPGHQTLPPVKNVKQLSLTASENPYAQAHAALPQPNPMALADHASSRAESEFELPIIDPTDMTHQDVPVVDMTQEGGDHENVIITASHIIGLVVAGETFAWTADIGEESPENDALAA